MGPLFALIGQFIALVIISSIISGITVAIIAIFSKKEKRRKRIIIGIFTPFYILFSFSLIAFVGLIIISQTKNVDIGFGDSWKIPINDSCEMIMVNIPDNAFIQCDGKRINDIVKIEKDQDVIYGLTSDKKYFAGNLNTKETKYYKSEKDLLDDEKITKLKLLDVNKFYHDKRWEICKFDYLIILIIALLIIGSTYPIIYRIVNRSIKDKQLTTNI
ncbi:MAG: hypothetical protein K8R54_01545 [Bacteroidales bacterium]|nr:hypothetical protein [Bacteroidales bacterium]